MSHQKALLARKLYTLIRQKIIKDVKKELVSLYNHTDLMQTESKSPYVIEEQLDEALSTLPSEWQLSSVPGMTEYMESRGIDIDTLTINPKNIAKTRSKMMYSIMKEFNTTIGKKFYKIGTSDKIQKKKPEKPIKAKPEKPEKPKPEPKSKPKPKAKSKKQRIEELKAKLLEIEFSDSEEKDNEFEQSESEEDSEPEIEVPKTPPPSPRPEKTKTPIESEKSDSEEDEEDGGFRSPASGEEPKPKPKARLRQFGRSITWSKW
jgi:Ulp1 family protease